MVVSRPSRAVTLATTKNSRFSLSNRYFFDHNNHSTEKIPFFSSSAGKVSKQAGTLMITAVTLPNKKKPIFSPPVTRRSTTPQPLYHRQEVVLFP
jgi:hypothetical protein